MEHLLRLALIASLFLSTRALHAQTSFTATLGGFREMKVNHERVATVSGITIQRDVGVVQMQSGKLYLCTPVEGRIVAAVFVGTGTFRYRPPIDVEREHLARFFEVEEIVEPITSAVLFFTDATARELDAAAKFSSGSPSSEASGALDAFKEIVTDPETEELDPFFMRALLNRTGPGKFHAAVNGTVRRRLFYDVDALEHEEVSLERIARSGAASDDYRETISQHHTQDDYTVAETVSDTVVDFSFDRYRITSTIQPGLEFSAVYDVDITMLRDVEWTHFYLMPELAIDSMRWGDGQRAELHRAGGSWVVWMRNTPGMKRGESGTLRLYAHGEPLGRVMNTVYLKSSSMWYPRNDFKHRAPAELTYVTPKQFMFASAGKPVGDPIESHVDGMMTSKWALEYPSRNISFNIGYFYELRATPDSLPTIVVLRDRDASKSVGTQIAWDVEHCIRFFQHLYGPLPSTYFSATQIPFSHGEAFPGLIHLSWLTFEDNLKANYRPGSEVTRDGFNEYFRAHEVAHQWWGIGLDFETYHDQWLSEGFATYSGLMYVQAVQKKNELFFDWLRYYRDRIVDNRSSLFGKGQQAGPIWLGSRTSTSSTEGDYDLIIYNKGAWVLHMLRLMMLDVNTLSDEKWRLMMRDFYGSYVGRYASTSDFQRTAEKHAGASLDWFFKQWVYGTAIPTYTYAYNVEPTPEGKYMLRVRVAQKDVPSEFKAYPVITIDFGGKRMSRVRRPVTGPTTMIELLLPEKPKEIIFNDFESVLATVEEVDWQ